MHRIVFAFLSLEQHRRAIESSPASYRPDRCPHCGSGCLWCHGCYGRKANRSADGELNPVPVPRFRCRSCTRTCSRLPLCICPRRWYSWSLQQNVLQLLIAGASLRRTATSSRWPITPCGAGGDRWWRLAACSPFICAAVLQNSAAVSVATTSGSPASSVCPYAKRWRVWIGTA
ncbi:DUF6431 domain-containing protein [Burkholderia ubonensis]|uniref:DUF6431 domain-containing protein n=1 Tax=Burkholderia ubonensis TaxID=101571 RepID=UPI001E611751|nr:DUF6431 domain-containing protein [Burkholderia ubonensis]